MDLDHSSKEIARKKWHIIRLKIMTRYQSGMSVVHFKLERSLARAIASEAWSQVVGSIISGNPPSDMSQEYFYSRPHPDTGFDYLQEQLKHLEIHKYKLGTQNIQATMRSHMDSLLVEAIENGDEEWGLPFRDSDDEPATYSQVVQANEYGDGAGLPLGNFEDSTESNTHSQVVPANKDEDLQVMGNIQCPIRSAVRSQVVQENEGEYQQEMENIQCAVRSAVRTDVVQANEFEDEQGMENIQCPVRSAVRTDVVQANEFEDEQGIENIQCPVRSAVRTDVVQANEFEDERSEAVQANEDEDEQGIENIQRPVRSAVRSEAVQANEDEDQQIDNIQLPIRSAVRSQVVQADEDKDEDEGGMKKIPYFSKTPTEVHKCEQQIEHLIKFGVHYKVVQANKGENEVTVMTLENTRAKGLSILYELLDMLHLANIYGDRDRKEESNVRSEVVELIKHLHDDGINTTRRDMVNLEWYIEYVLRRDKDASIEYMRRYVMLMYQILNTTSCQRNICRMRGKAEGIPCEYWEVMQANKEISSLLEELLELLVENGHVHGGEKPMRFKLLKLIKVLHHYGVDTIRNPVEEALKDVNQNYGNINKDSRIGYKKKALEVTLRICDIQTCQKTLYDLILTAASGQVLYT